MLNNAPQGPAGTFTRRRLGWALLFVLLLAGALAAAWGLKARMAASHAPPKTAPPLQFSAGEVTRPQRMAMPQRIVFSGPLVAPRTAVVRAKASGTLLALAVDEGSRVRAGQSLGRVDLADLESRNDERSAAVESARAGLVEATRQHEANVSLAEQRFIADTALQSSQARLDAARAQLRATEAQLASSRIGLREAALIAPIDGLVGKRHVVPGEKLASEQEVVTLVDLSTLELAGTVATHEVSKLAVGQAVAVQIEGVEQVRTGRIDRIAPQAMEGSRAIGVVVRLENRDETLRAGQYAQAEVTLADAAERLTVPLAALGQASGQAFVWTIEDGVLVRRIVITGREDAGTGRIEVLQGLQPQALVLAARFDGLKEGAAAAVTGQAASQPASRPAALEPSVAKPAATGPASLGPAAREPAVAPA
jgi:membrane fusion protein (multidrug efflux system)